MTDRIAELEALIATVDLGSQAAAADALSLTRMAVSRLLRDLEVRVGEPLLIRTTRSQTLTEAGAQLLEKARPILAAYSTTVRQSVATATVAGKLRISAPVSFGTRCLMPLLPEFHALNPRVELDVVLNDRHVDLVDEGFDLAIRVGNPVTSGFAAKRLSTAQTVICAAPAYLAAKGTPQRPEDLYRHNCLRYAYSTHDNQWVLTSAEGAEHKIAVSGNLICNNGDALVAAATAGQGIVRQPSFLVADDIRAGRLLPLFPEFTTRLLTITAIHVPIARPRAAVLALLDFLATSYEKVEL